MEICPCMPNFAVMMILNRFQYSNGSPAASKGSVDALSFTNTQKTPYNLTATLILTNDGNTLTGKKCKSINVYKGPNGLTGRGWYISPVTARYALVRLALRVKCSKASINTGLGTALRLQPPEVPPSPPTPCSCSRSCSFLPNLPRTLCRHLCRLCRPAPSPRTFIGHLLKSPISNLRSRLIILCSALHHFAVSCTTLHRFCRHAPIRLFDHVRVNTSEFDFNSFEL